MKKLRADPVRNAKAEAYKAEYYQKNPNFQRYKSYRSIDNKKYGGATLTWEFANVAMSKPCNYCALEVSNGLDRRDNTQGHHEDNVVPCCFVCNTILGDLPAEAKDLLAPGLRDARQKGFLDTWVPPQKRQK
jgi:hypothetical protein